MASEKEGSRTRTGHVSTTRLALHDVAGAERGQRTQYIIKQQIRDEERRAEVVAEDGIDEREETHGVAQGSFL